MEASRKLLLEIAFCPIASEALRDDKGSSPCGAIVRSQSSRQFQLPEPWSGKIQTAPILFISSNPSIDDLEEYPARSWEPDRIVDFFDNRFTSDAGWVRDGIYALRRDGTTTPWVRFWAAARSRASEIMDKKPREIIPGVDFALTEIVHCKSRKEEGVREAQACCAERYLVRVLSLSPSKIVIVYGKQAGNAIRHYLRSKMTPLQNGLSELVVANHHKMVAFLPHPNERGSRKTLVDNIGRAGVSQLRTYFKRNHS